MSTNTLEPGSTSKMQQSSSATSEVPKSKRLYSVSSTVPPSFGCLLMGSKFRTWADISLLNYFKSVRSSHVDTPVPELFRTHSVLSKDESQKYEEDEELSLRRGIAIEQFPKHLTSLLNEDNYWGCYYIFPDYYADGYSPVVPVLDVKDVADLVGGVLTRDMIAACLTYLRRNPILGDLVYIKLDLSSKHLINIDVLQHYKYLVYLDLSSNLLTELTVLSYLLYLQFLSVAFNRLNKVLDYETPQWFLTEVHYKYNSVKRIRDLSAFWSITTLDLSHNNIKSISGLEQLRYLRRLDLSFNHIQRIENLSHLRLLWLDLSYNNISSFEFTPEAGLWTLLHLEYLNINENSLTSLKLFLYCTRLRELHARNNRLVSLIEIPIYMGQMRRLIVLDLRANPICASPGYKQVVVNTLPYLLSLDAMELDPVEQRTLKMETSPDITTFATRRLLRLLYIQQLSKALVSPYVPPADTTDVPLVVLVGHEAVGKGNLARRLATECSSNITLARQHTTASYHFPDHYRIVTRSKFDDMLLAGDFLTYTEMQGQSYGLSREEAFVKDGKVRIVNLDLVGALMLKLRGYRPYLILATCQDKKNMARKQQLRKRFRNMANRDSWTTEVALERSTLQVLLSGRIIITGILNEILMELPDQKEASEFVMESKCSLMMDSEARQAIKDYAWETNWLALLSSSPSSSLEDLFSKRYQDRNSQMEPSLYSLYKESQGAEEYQSDVQNGLNSVQGASARRQPENRTSHVNQSSFVSSTCKGSSKSSKSVTFTSQEIQVDPTGMMIDPMSEENKSKVLPKSVSVRAPWVMRTNVSPNTEDSDLWFAFLTETGIVTSSDCNHISSMDTYAQPTRQFHTKLEAESLIEQMQFTEDPENIAIQAKNEEYEEIHRQNPGLFWDSVAYIENKRNSRYFLCILVEHGMDYPFHVPPVCIKNISSFVLCRQQQKQLKKNEYALDHVTAVELDVNMDNLDDAFYKVRLIIKDIVDSQKTLKPMLNIDFANVRDYPNVQKRLIKIRNQIAPHQLFY